VGKGAARVRLEIVFEGGTSVSVAVESGTADELARALAAVDGSPGTFSLEADDGRYVLALGKIVFVRRTEREQVVGFGPGE
jgi:hypothetical protein